MSEQLVALTRQDCRLSAIVSRAVVQDEQPPQYGLGEVGVDTVKTLGVGERSALDAWRRLDEVRLDDARSVASAIAVLLATVPMSAPSAGASPAQGRAWLCQAGRLGPRTRGAPGPARAHATPAAGERLERPRSNASIQARDPYAAYHHDATDAPALQSLPPRFRAYVLPLLRGRSWADVRRALSLFWALDLQRDASRLALAARLLNDGRVHGLGWLALVAHEDPVRRDVLASLVLQSGAYSRDPAAIDPSALTALASASGEAYPDHLAHLLHALRHAVPPAEVLDELFVTAEFAPGLRRHPPGRFAPTGLCPRPRRHPERAVCAVQDLRGVLRHVQQEPSFRWRHGFVSTLWSWSVADAAHAAILGRPALLAWPPDVSWAVLRSLAYGDGTGWSAAERLDAFERVLAAVPATHARKAVEELDAVLDSGRLDPARAAEAQALVTRIAAPPFRPDLWTAASSLLLSLAARRRGPLPTVPEATLHRLERALADDNASQPLRDGLRAMADLHHGFVWDALTDHPAPLIAVARQVGLLSAPRRRALLKRFRAQPVVQRGFVRRPLDVVCAAIERLVRCGAPSPIPRRLRDHREGRITLSPGSLERHRQAVVRRLLPFRLGVLRLMVLEEVGRDLRTDRASAAERHALQLLGSIVANRRLLRRVLKLPPAERVRFVEEHPANRTWLARHPRADAAAWRHGLRDDLETGGGPLRLALETEPLEVLRIGTRVGSCLALGGINSDSAVAVMADVNKQVVCARDAAGSFVARQVIAITEDERLVCSAVYPQGVPAAVADAFAAYDRRLSEALGLAMVRDPMEEYAIARVVARRFYDDGVWDRLAEDAPPVGDPSPPAPAALRSARAADVAVGRRVSLDPGAVDAARSRQRRAGPERLREDEPVSLARAAGGGRAGPPGALDRARRGHAVRHVGGAPAQGGPPRGDRGDRGGAVRLSARAGPADSIDADDVPARPGGEAGEHHLPGGQAQDAAHGAVGPDRVDAGR